MHYQVGNFSRDGNYQKESNGNARNENHSNRDENYLQQVYQ